MRRAQRDAWCGSAVPVCADLDGEMRHGQGWWGAAVRMCVAWDGMQRYGGAAENWLAVATCGVMRLCRLVVMGRGWFSTARSGEAGA